MSKPIAVITNDWHLKPGTEEKVYKSVEQMVFYCVENKIKWILAAGDLFDSRSFQRQEVLITFGKILDLIQKYELKMVAIPGNHDKSVYASKDSFLDPFKWHPALAFHSDLTQITLEGVTICLIPFFAEEILVEKIKEAPESDVLISHFEMNGSTYLGRTASGKKISRGDLKKFKKTYLGHYHDHFEITKDIVHLPSLRQYHFGENSNKGFTVLHKDLSYSIVKGVFEEFKKVIVNLDTIPPKELKELIKTHSNSPDIIRFELTGSDERLKAIDKKQFSEVGIDVKVKYKEINFDLSKVEVPKVIETYTEEDIKKDFKNFCKEKDLDYQVGLKLLTKFLKGK